MNSVILYCKLSREGPGSFWVPFNCAFVLWFASWSLILTQPTGEYKSLPQALASSVKIGDGGLGSVWCRLVMSNDFNAYAQLSDCHIFPHPRWTLSKEAYMFEIVITVQMLHHCLKTIMKPAAHAVAIESIEVPRKHRWLRPMYVKKYHWHSPLIIYIGIWWLFPLLIGATPKSNKKKKDSESSSSQCSWCSQRDRPQKKHDGKVKTGVWRNAWLSSCKSLKTIR